MTLKEIANVVKDVSQIDIRKHTRRDEYPVARSVYYKIARKYTLFGLTSIAKEVNIKAHRTVLVGLQNFDKNIENANITIIYAKSLKKLGLALEDPIKKMFNEFIELSIDKNHNLPKYIVTHLKEYSDSQLLDVYETRLKPFKRASDLIVRPKVIPKINGAKFTRQKESV